MKSRLVLAAAVLLPVWFLSDLRCAASPATRPPESAAPAASMALTPAPEAQAQAQPPAPPDVVATQTAPDLVATQTAPDLFVSTVRPILLGHCAPCHETGGVMYERLPFDRAETVASHSTGVLKRIKAPDERAAIEQWLASRGK